MNLTQAPTPLLSALSTGLTTHTERTPEVLTQIVETMNTELGQLGVFTICEVIYCPSGYAYQVKLQQASKPFNQSFVQLNSHNVGAGEVNGDDVWYSFCGEPVDLTYQSLYDQLVKWLSNPQNILPLNLDIPSSNIQATLT